MCLLRSSTSSKELPQISHTYGLSRGSSEFKNHNLVNKKNATWSLYHISQSFVLPEWLVLWYSSLWAERKRFPHVSHLYGRLTSMSPVSRVTAHEGINGVVQSSFILNSLEWTLFLWFRRELRWVKYFPHSLHLNARLVSKSSRKKLENIYHATHVHKSRPKSVSDLKSDVYISTVLGPIISH